MTRSEKGRGVSRGGWMSEMFRRQNQQGQLMVGMRVVRESRLTSALGT